jgi:hypothetical protein
MTALPPDFEELAGGDDLSPDERDRLRRAHDLLVAAGPPPELPTRLRRPEPPRARLIALPRKYRATALAAAVLAALALVGAGYVIGAAGNDEPGSFSVPMTGPRGAGATLVVYDPDNAGNWPMKLKVWGLGKLQAGEVYELWLTRDGKLVAQCGSFTASGTVTVPLNAPYRLRSFTGWVVVKSGSQEPVLRTETV